MHNRYALWNSPRKLLMMIIAVAVLVRVGSALYIGNHIQELPGIFDEVSYHNLAIRLLDGHGFSFGERWWPGTAAGEPTAHWSYLYTLFVAAVYGLFGRDPLLVRLIQAIITGLLMPWLVYRVSCRLFVQSPSLSEGSGAMAQRVGLVAAAIAAIYIYFFYYAAALITESFYIVSILACFDLALQISQSEKNRQRPWFLLGFTLGSTILLRQLFLLFVPFLFLWLWWAKRPRLTAFLLPLAIIVAMILPWTVRNYLAFGQLVPLNTNAGYAFFWGNHPSYGTRFVPILPTRAYYEMVPAEVRALDEAAKDSELLKRAIGFIAADPGRYLLLSLSRIPAYFIFWPSPASSLLSNISRVGSFGLFLPFMLYGFIRLWSRHASSLRERLASPLALLVLFTLFYTGIHLLSWTLVRYRIPVDAILIIFAGFAIVDLVGRIQVRRPRVIT